MLHWSHHNQWLALVVIGAVLTCMPPALAERRVALVVGNGAYSHAGELVNPTNDAADMASALSSVGFTVVKGVNLSKSDFERVLREFAAALKGADVAVFFYSGHGLQVGGSNYLVPIDARLSTAEALDLEMVRLDVVQRIMERNSKTNILFLDACRNNPLARNLARSMGTRGSEVGRGLAAAESGIGTLVSFSTQPGNVALDGTGRNSPFTGPLVKRLATPGEDVLTILTAVRNDVLASTSDKQVPWENHALRSKFYFVQPAVSASAKLPVPPLSEAAHAWASVKDTTDPAILEVFIAKFPDTVYTALAKAQLEKLKSSWFPSFDIWKAPPPGKPLDPAPSSAKAQTAAPNLVAGTSFRDCADACPEMVVVPAGTFTMGSTEFENSQPIISVTIRRAFAVSKFAVTFDEWEACVAGGGCVSARAPDDAGWGRGRRPVINVSWNNAKEYLTWLSSKTGKTYRLLTEAEWEYAARAGKKSRYYWGEKLGYGNAHCLLCGPPQSKWRTLPVGSFKPNAFGLYDMHGNVSQWVEDCYKDKLDGAVSDGSAVTTGPCHHRVTRGVSIEYDARLPGIAKRGLKGAEYFDSSVGIRVARVL